MSSATARVRVESLSAPAPQAAFTLVEAVVSIVLFSVMSLSIFKVTMMTFEISHTNIFHTSAYSVAQGFLEQIKSLPAERIAHYATVTVSGTINISNSMETRSASLLSETVGSEDIDDWLVPNTLNPETLSDTMEVLNHKRVLVDIDEQTGQRRMMDMWIDVEIHRMENTPGNPYLIDLQFSYQVPGRSRGTKVTKSVYQRISPRNYGLKTENMFIQENYNTGRLQLVTALLNFNSL